MTMGKTDDGDSGKPPHHRTARARRAIRKSRELISMLQGTMGLEGCGLRKEDLKDLHKKTVRDLLERKR